MRESGAHIFSHPLYTSSYDKFYDRTISLISDAERLDALSEAAERGIGLERNAGLFFTSAVRGKWVFWIFPLHRTMENLMISRMN